MKGEDNVVADTLFRIYQIKMSAEFDFEELSQEQAKDEKIESLLLLKTTSCKFTQLVWAEKQVPIVYEVSTGHMRPVIPSALTRQAFVITYKLIRVVKLRWGALNANNLR